MKVMKLLFVGTVLCVFFAVSAPNIAFSNPSSNTYASDLDFAKVRSNVLEFIKSKGLTVFAEFDHAKNAKDVKLELAPTTVIVFGSPQVGTKLMQEFPNIGIALPLKVLISQDKNGKVVVSHEDLAMLFAPYGVKQDNEILKKMQGLLKALGQTASK